MNIPGNGIESNEENMFKEKGDAEFDPVNGSDSDHAEESVEEVNEPSTSRGRGCGHGRKSNVVVVVVVVGDEDNKHNISFIYLLEFQLCVSELTQTSQVLPFSTQQHVKKLTHTSTVSTFCSPVTNLLSILHILMKFLLHGNAKK